MKIAMTPKPKARVMLSEPDYRTLLALLDGERIGAGTRRYTQWADRMFRVFRNRPILINSDPASLAALYINGSFVTAKEYPSDYDGCWETTGVIGALLDPVLRDFTNGRAAQKAKFLGEPFSCRAIAQAKPQRVFLDFFQRDKQTDDPKGIVGLDLATVP